MRDAGRRRLVTLLGATRTCSPKREELHSESLSKGTGVRVVGLQRRWELNSRTGTVLGPSELDGRVLVLVQELLLGQGGERAREKVDNIVVLNGDG